MQTLRSWRSGRPKTRPNDIDHQEARRFKELTAAFTAGDREAFEAAKESGLAELHEPEGVDEPTDGEGAQ